ncbi:glycosyltransferase family 2 protein [Arsukibacterium indicum]|uniref:Glycosyltransferase n=1 Tax=Arsukibacterium indicum TaxID=2848612 RepID=A0ABS6MG59_9GAMM|nr:glycosyltransferase [Arsukibacterium indicum]MBV2127805.1 glycosyltransferase [Arsukibacterium indicum]
MSVPKISVCIVTYNQVNYIQKCVESILQQQVNCDFEVIVGDDASTDGTRDVLLQLQQQYPTQLKLVLHDKNVGPINNYFSVHNQAQGEFVSHLDGDDYALPGKLQVLKDFLEENDDCRIVWHRMVILNEKGQTAVGMPLVPLKQSTGLDKFYLKDLAKFYSMTGCHSGSMYRRAAKKLTGYDKPTIDYYITLTFVQDGGYAAYIDEPYGVYRFFKQDKTLTRQKGNMYVGLAKLDFIEHMLSQGIPLNREFAAQTLFELFVRSYLRYPLKWRFFKLFLRCRALPRFSDLKLLWTVFNNSRNTSKQKAFLKGYSGKI